MDCFNASLLRRSSYLQAASFAAVATLSATPMTAHPHVFVDGGIDFVFGADGALNALELTWLYDEFETLYTMSRFGLSLNSEGELSEEDRQQLVEELSVWPEDFDGSAHLTMGGAAVALDWPKNVDARLLDGRLEMTFVRDLIEPVELDAEQASVAFYESTYFFAFKITNTPKLVGDAGRCSAEVIPFSPDPNDASLLAKLAKLSREETPEDENVGILFADRIAVRCE